MLKGKHFATLLFFITQIIILYGHLSMSEEKKIINQFAPPQELQEKLDDFFSDEKVKLFFDTTLLATHTPLRKLLGKLTSGEMRSLINNNKSFNTLWQKTNKNIFESICQKYNLEVLSSPLKKTIIFTSPNVLPNFVIKIANKHVIAHAPNKKVELAHLKNVSRVLLNQKILEFSQRYQTSHLYPLKKFLYHVPWRPLDLTDKNFIVLSERIYMESSIQDNKKAFQALFNYEMGTFNKPYEHIFKEFFGAAYYAGISDLTPTNIFFITHNGVEKIIISDTERDGFQDTNQCFFQKDPQQIYSCFEKGISFFAQKILDLPKEKIPSFFTYIKNLCSIQSEPL